MRIFATGHQQINRRPFWQSALAVSVLLAFSLLMTACNHTNQSPQLSTLPAPQKSSQKGVIQGTRQAPDAPSDRPVDPPVDPQDRPAKISKDTDQAGFQPAAPLVSLAPLTPSTQSAPPSNTPPQAKNRDRVVAALLLPLTGKSAHLGTAMRRAAEIAFFDLAGKTLELTYHDTKGVPDTAAQAAKAAIADGADVVIGPVFAESVAAAAPLLSAANIPTLAFSNAASVAEDGIFILGAQPAQQIDRLIRHVAATGLRTIGIFAPDNPYGRLVVAAAERTAAASGVQITKIAFFTPGDPDAADRIRAFANYDVRRSALTAERRALATQNDRISALSLRRLAALDSLGDPPYEALLLPIGGNELRRLAPHFPFFDVDPNRVRYLGTALWADPTLGREPALVGGWFAAPDPRNQSQLNQKFTAAHGTPAPVLAALTFDAVALAAVLQIRTDDEVIFDRDSLLQPSGFVGATGLFRLLPNGQNQRGLAIMKVAPDRLTTVDPEPEVFDHASN